MSDDSPKAVHRILSNSAPSANAQGASFDVDLNPIVKELVALNQCLREFAKLAGSFSIQSGGAVEQLGKIRTVLETTNFAPNIEVNPSFSMPEPPAPNDGVINLAEIPAPQYIIPRTAEVNLGLPFMVFLALQTALMALLGYALYFK